MWQVRQVSILRPERDACTAILISALTVLCGCGMPGAPLPPSLNLPNRVTDLAAVRTGDQVSLSWTMPTKTTDKLLLKGDIPVRVCRSDNRTANVPCLPVADLQFAPGSSATFTDTLPSALATGHPVWLPYPAVPYFVEILNRKGQTAGPSNTAEALAGEAPPAIANLTAELRTDGVLLHWTPAPLASPSVVIRLVRKLLTPAATKPVQGMLSEPAEPLEQTFLVPSGALHGEALDTHIRFGETYEYRAQSVDRVTITDKTIELASVLSPPVRIEALNIFPPAVPKGLAAVATPGENGSTPAIDLNWQPDSGVDLAGYIVYRRDSETGSTPGEWQRISPAQPIVGPAYHDASVVAGHTYAYSVSAIGQNGRESAHSAEAQETVLTP